MMSNIIQTIYFLLGYYPGNMLAKSETNIKTKTHTSTKTKTRKHFQGENIHAFMHYNGFFENRAFFECGIFF